MIFWLTKFNILQIIVIIRKLSIIDCTHISIQTSSIIWTQNRHYGHLSTFLWSKRALLIYSWYILDFLSSWSSQPNIYIILVFVLGQFLGSMPISHNSVLPLTHFIFAYSFSFSIFFSSVSMSYFLLVFVSVFFFPFPVTHSVAAQ